MKWISQLLCWHDWLTVFQPNRIYMRCQACGKESTGWTIEIRKARQT